MAATGPNEGEMPPSADSSSSRLVPPHEILLFFWSECKRDMTTSDYIHRPGRREGVGGPRYPREQRNGEEQPCVMTASGQVSRRFGGTRPLLYGSSRRALKWQLLAQPPCLRPSSTYGGTPETVIRI